MCTRWQSDITLKHPAIWGLFPCCVDPKLLDEHQEGKYKDGKPKQEPPRIVVKGDGQGVVCNYLEWLLALHLKVVQVHPGEVLNQLVSVRHDRGLPYANLTLFSVNL